MRSLELSHEINLAFGSYLFSLWRDLQSTQFPLLGHLPVNRKLPFTVDYSKIEAIHERIKRAEEARLELMDLLEYKEK